MRMLKPKRDWFFIARLRGWSWTERLVVLALALAPIVALFILGRDGSWIAGVLAVVAFAALNVIVYRHGGWQLLGPHFYYDVVRLARRGRSTVLRVVYILALFFGLAFVYESTSFQANLGPNELARVSERFAYTLFMVQNLAVMVLTPAYLGSAIAEEKERRTLELLFTTHLSNTEIVLGKLTSRLIHLVGFVLAGFPILSLVQFWGGIDMLLIAGNVLNTVLNILSIGSICLLASVLARTVTGAVMTSYAVILPIGFCCMFSLRGFPFVLQDARSGGGGNVTVQDLGILCVIHLVIVVAFLSLAIAALREQEPLGAVLPPEPERYTASDGPTKVGRRLPAPVEITAVQVEPIHVTAKPPPIVEPPRVVRHREPELESEFAVPYKLPPITDNALMWKERYVGGPPWFFSPVVLVPALPFIVTGFLVLGFWFLRSMSLDREEYRRSIEGWSVVLRFFYYCFLGAYLLGVGFRAAGSVTRERQQQTLDPLLLLPIDRGEILWAKLSGALIRGWPWLALLASVVTFGTLMGAFHPFSAIVLLLAPWAPIVFIAGLGLLLSVQLGTVMRANLVMLIIVIILGAASFVFPLGLGPFTYLEPFAFSMWHDPWREFDPILGLRQPRWASLFVFIGYLVIGLYLLHLAFSRFDKRAGHAES